MLGGLTRGGYRLDYADTPNAYQRCQESETGIADLTHTIGLSVGGDGRVTDVLWGGAAFDAGVTVGTIIAAVEGRPFTAERLRTALNCRTDRGLELVLRRGVTVRTAAVRTPGKLRYPRLVRTLDEPDRLGAILRARRVTQV